jgi:putative nucleotidyltransferase with HDIG domain
MNNSACAVDGEKVKETLKTLSVKFNTPFVFLNTSGKELFSVAPETAGSACPAGCCQGAETFTIPVRYLTDIIGSLAVPRDLPRDREIAAAAAYCLETVLRLEAEIEDLSSEIVRLYEELALTYSLSSKLGSEMDVDTICRRVLEEADKMLSASNMSIMLLEGNTDILRTRYSIGSDAETAREFTMDSSSEFIGHVFQQGEPVTVCDIYNDCTFTLPYPAKSVLCVPLVTDDKTIGLLLASDKLSGEEFWSQELKLMGMLATETAASIRKAQLYENISNMFINTVESFATAIDAKDPYTYGHSRRVAQISVSICKELGMAKKETKLVELAAFLHDIGKIGTPENILHKPGALQPDEFEKIKEHPAKGAAILSNISEFSEIIKWIKHHHEWYDGKGYPDRIAAEHIPIEARIITIADAYDAMTSDRPYRKGMPPLEVIKIMEEFTRSQFDPDILSAFRRLMDEGKIEPH